MKSLNEIANMNDIEGIPDLINLEARVCLPYNFSVIDLARWDAIIKQKNKSTSYEIEADKGFVTNSGEDIIDLMVSIKTNILDYSLKGRLIRETYSNSYFYFDNFQRFIAFVGRQAIVREFFPFATYLMRENYIYSQVAELGDDLLNIFNLVHKVE